MLELLRDPVWQFVGAALSLLALVISLLIYNKQSQRKELSYDVIKTSQLLYVEAQETIKDKIRILYEGEQVHNLELLTMEFTNSGNQPILPTEYERPITITLDEPGRVLSGEYIAKSSINLKASITDRTRITIQPMLLNPGDSFIINAVVADHQGGVVDGRIIGVKSLTKRRLKLLKGSYIIFRASLPLMFLSVLAWLASLGPIAFFIQCLGMSMLLIGLGGFMLGVRPRSIWRRRLGIDTLPHSRFVRRK